MACTQACKTGKVSQSKLDNRGISKYGMGEEKVELQGVVGVT